MFRIGLKGVIRKVISRLLETKRNKKFYGIGIGEILNSDKDKVLFFAPNHNPEWDFIVLEKSFVLQIDRNHTLDDSFKDKFNFPISLIKYIGYSSFSGIKINTDLLSNELLKINSFLYKKYTDKKNNFPAKYLTSRPILKRKEKKLKGVIFGLGNYAKTIILPNTNKNISIERVHEIDPDQISYLQKKRNIELSTSPFPIDNKLFDAWFIAGYHSTHIDLALRAIEQDAYAIVEKPLATNFEEFDKFQSKIDGNHSKFFCCFHKRYSYLNKLLKKDIDIKKPINMHCIVYEIPLPKLHWYNWPSSKSRIVSNACHWIDYFLFLNSYSEIEEQYIWNPLGQDFSINLKLKNGSYFSMDLTDTGSPRLGVRDYIEIRQNDLTVKMIDSSQYISETKSNIIRKKKINPLSAYKDMYRVITQKIDNKEKGDSFTSLLSTKVTLDLDALINES